MNEIADGIYDRIAANTNITNLLSTRIYRDLAPQGADRPYITLQRTGGGDIDETPSTRHEAVYMIQGVSVVSTAQAGIIAGYIHDSLHKAEPGQSATPLVVAGWVVIWCRAEGFFEIPELNPDDGEILYRAGRNFRVILAKST